MNKLILALMVVLLSISVTAANVPEGMSSAVDMFCEDSDGDDLHSQGTVEDADGNWTDHCSMNFLIEYICEGDYHDRIGQQCDNGCVDGACIPNSTQEEEPEEEPEEEIETEEEEIEEVEEEEVEILTDEFTTTITDSLEKNMVVLDDIDPYEMSEDELKQFVATLSDIFKEDPSKMLHEAKILKEEGNLINVVNELKKKHPVKAKIQLNLHRNKDERFSGTLDKVSRISSVLMQSKIAELEMDISLDDVFERRSDGPYVRQYTEMVNLVIPDDYNKTGPIILNITEDAYGEKIGHLSVMMGNGTIDSAKLVSIGERILIKTSTNRLINIKTSVEAVLNDFSEKSGLKLRSYSIPTEKQEKMFADAAEGLKLVERVGVLSIEKYNLRNSEEIESAKIMFKVEGNILGTRDKESVKIFRLSEGKVSVLDTSYEGLDSEGYAIFSAESPGLSTFALYITEKAKSSKKDGSGSLVKWIVILLAICVLIGAGVFVAAMISKRKHTDNF